jgi:hypothetical protein
LPGCIVAVALAQVAGLMEDSQVAPSVTQVLILIGC